MLHFQSCLWCGTVRSPIYCLMKRISGSNHARGIPHPSPSYTFPSALLLPLSGVSLLSVSPLLPRLLCFHSPGELQGSWPVTPAPAPDSKRAVSGSPRGSDNTHSYSGAKLTLIVKQIKARKPQVKEIARFVGPNPSTGHVDLIERSVT